MSTKLNVSITPNYRLQVDAMQYVLFELHTVDPTKAPAWTRLNDAAIEETGVGLPTETREEWRSMDKFYPLTATGLKAAILYVAMLEGNNNLADVEGLTFADLIAAYTEEIRKIGALMDGALNVKGAKV